MKSKKTLAYVGIALGLLGLIATVAFSLIQTNPTIANGVSQETAGGNSPAINANGDVNIRLNVEQQ